jgi:hypothetical protein
MAGPSFFKLLLDATGCSRDEMRRALRLSRDEMATLEATSGNSEVPVNEIDPMWAALEAYVDRQLAIMLAVRFELTRKMAVSRKRRIVRHNRMRNR